MGKCIFCDNESKEYEICSDCYNYIMNKYNPEGIIKSIFSIIPTGDGFHGWSDIAIMRYKIKELFNKNS